MEFEYLVPMAPTLTRTASRGAAAAGEPGAACMCALWTTRARPSFHSRASVVASGTATVKGAHGILCGHLQGFEPSPMPIARCVVTVPPRRHVNLIAGKRVVPELTRKTLPP